MYLAGSCPENIQKYDFYFKLSLIHDFVIKKYDFFINLKLGMSHKMNLSKNMILHSD